MPTNMLGVFKKQAVTLLVSNVANIYREGTDLLSNDTIILNEKLTANLFCSGDILIGPDGILSGNITSEVCTISGAVHGDITSTEMLRLKSTAVINGNIRTPLLDIEEGAIINGRITVNPDSVAVKVDLMNKLNRLTTADLLSPKIKLEVADTQSSRTGEERKAEVKQSFGTLRAAEKREPLVTDKPKIIQKELSAAAPQPTAAENAEVNNRWW